MPAEFTWTGYDILQRKLRRIANPDPREALQDCEQILVDGNREGVLAGLDKDNRPLVPVKYRTGTTIAVRTSRKITVFGVAKFRGYQPKFTGLGGFAEHGNLTTAQYKRLTGPPLAPRRDQSRVITNYVTRSSTAPDANGAWKVQAGWHDVLSRKGVPFLQAHFHGGGHLPVRNLAGIRPQTLRRCAQRINEFVREMLRRVG